MIDKELIEEIRNNPDRFGQVYDAHYSIIFNYCFKRTKDFNASKDITSETFLKAFLNINKFKWRGISIKSWLYRIATNEINLHYRSKKYRPSVLSEIGSAFSLETRQNQRELAREMEAAELELERNIQFIKVQKEVHKLPLKYQEVISLKYFEKLKIKEITVIVNKPEGTVKSLLSRGIGLLRQQL